MQIKIVGGILAGCILCLASTQASALPQQFLGLWANDIASCNDPLSDGRATVGPGEVEFYASSYSIRKWSRRNGVWEGRGRLFDEGEEGSRPGRITLQLAPDGRLHVNTGGEKSMLVRCEGGR